MNLNVQKAPSTSLLTAHGQVNNSDIFESNILNLNVSNVYNNYVSVSHLNLLSVRLF